MASTSASSTPVGDVRVVIKARRRTDHGRYESRKSYERTNEGRRDEPPRDPRRPQRRTTESTFPTTSSTSLKRSRNISSSPAKRSKNGLAEEIDYRRLHFVVDTNYLFKDPDLECRFFTYPGIPGISSTAASESPLIYIPYAVVNELDGLKKSSYDARKANTALSKILGGVQLKDDNLVAAAGHNGPVRVQSRSEFDRIRDRLGRSATNDELILATAEKLADVMETGAKASKDRAGPVVLLTDDVNLTIRPAKFAVSRISHEDLRKYRVLAQPQNFPTETMRARPPPPVPQPKPIMAVVSQLRNAQKLLGRLGTDGIFRCLGTVARDSLKKSYGDLWEAVCLRRFPEPWSPCDVLGIFDHYAFSVFECDGWKKGVKDAALDAKSQLQNLQALSDARLKASDILGLVKSLRALMDQFPRMKADVAAKSQMETFKKLLENVESEVSGKVEPMTCDSVPSIQSKTDAGDEPMDMDVDM